MASRAGDVQGCGRIAPENQHPVFVIGEACFCGSVRLVQPLQRILGIGLLTRASYIIYNARTPHRKKYIYSGAPEKHGSLLVPGGFQRGPVRRVGIGNVVTAVDCAKGEREER